MILNDPVLEASIQVRDMTRAAVLSAIASGALPQSEIPAFGVEIPADTANGDFSTNIAMTGAKAFRMPPQKIAGAILDALDFSGTFFSHAETAGPGFLNFFLTPEWFSGVLESVLAKGDDYGRTDYGKGKKVMVEFVSANPTGPMHMGNARGGAIGDCLAAVLDSSGHAVTREFYVNDAGNQIEKFAISLEARYLQIYLGEEAPPFPEDGYQGGDITDRAKEFAGLYGDKYVAVDTDERRKALVDFALPANLAAIKKDLSDYRIAYDNWFHESSLYESGLVDKTVGILTARGLTYQKEGALWYKATEFGAEKDEVLIRQNGNATYFAADIAYHYDKFALRGFEQVIDVWGADHHGHVARLKGAMDAAGLSGDKLDIVLMQLVRLMKDGEPYRMSKRTGRSVTLRDLLDIVPVDAARFFFNMQQPGSSMDFDLDLAVQETSQNPVFYVQYAHARICSIFRILAEEDGIAARAVSADELLLLREPQEIALIRQLSLLPGVISNAAARLDPSSLTHYAEDLAAAFHKFYDVCRIRDQKDEAIKQARLSLCLCARTVLANTLRLMKIHAPERML